MGTTPKRKRSDAAPVSPDVVPKRRSMRILHARFTRARTSDSRASGDEAVVTIDDDSDDDDTAETEANIPEQEDIRDMGSAHEDFDEGDYCGHDEDAFVHSSSYPGEQGDSDASPGFVDSNVPSISVEPVLDMSFIQLFFYIFFFSCTVGCLFILCSYSADYRHYWWFGPCYCCC